MSDSERDVVAARLARVSNDDLEAALGDLGRSLAAPVPADLPGSVMRRLEGHDPTGRRSDVPWRRWLRDVAAGNVPLRRSLVLALIAAIVLTGIAAALGLGLPGVRVFFGPGPSAVSSPGASVSPTPAPSASVPGSSLALGDAVSLSDARAEAGYPLGVPALAGLGPPDAVWLDTRGAGPVATLVWGPRAGTTEVDGVGLLLSEIPGRIDPTYFEKFLGQGTRLQPVAVGDGGWWITGALHEVAVVGTDGNARFETIRLAGNVLLWSVGHVTFRLETSLDQPGALEIARSVH